MSGLCILNRRLVFITLLIAALLFTTACSEIRDVKNPRVGELVEKISQMEYIVDVKADNMAFNLNIDVHFERGFTEEDSLKILELAKYYLDADTVEALRIEFDQDRPPDTRIFIRDDEGSIVYSFRGSCYASNDRTVPPAFKEYRWVDTGAL